MVETSDQSLITLKNFRCHENNTFHLYDNGLILLSGESGSGKSTILNSIVYALFGKFKSPYTHGQKKKNTQVNLNIFGLNIVRNSKPRSLSINIDGKQYEEDEAQEIINKIIIGETLSRGLTYEEFMISSYVVQRKDSSILSSPSSEKLRLIEFLAFQGEEHIKLKAKVKDKLASLQLNISSINGSMITIKAMIDDKKKSLKKVDKVIDKQGRTVKELRKQREDWINENKNISKNIDSLNVKLDEFRKEEKDKELLIRKKRDIEVQIEQLTSMKSNLPPEVKKIDDLPRLTFIESSIQRYLLNKSQIEEVTIKLQEKDKLISQLLSDNEVQKIKENIALVEREISDIKRKTIESDIKIGMKMEAVNKLKTLFKTIEKEFNIKDKNALIFKCSKVKAFLNKKKKFIISNSIKTLGNCPKCGTNLALKQDKLVQINNNVLNKDECNITISQIDEWIQIIDKLNDPSKYKPINIPDIKPLQEKHKKLLEQIDAHNKVEYRLEIIDKSIPFCVDKKQQENNEIENDIQGQINEQRLKEIQRTIHNVISVKSNNQEHVKLSKAIDEKNKALKDINILIKKSKHDSSSEIEKEISGHTNRLMKNTSNIQSITTLIDDLLKYQQYKKEKKVIIDLETQYKEEKQKLNDIESKIESCIELSSAIREAEVKAIQYTINVINSHAQIHLSNLFYSPISINLKTEAEKDSRNIFLEIQYKGEEYSSIDELSGGERQRAELAFVLGMNDMVGSKLLLLDESLSNLNETINIETIEYLKDICGNKLIIMIAHNMVEGLFDNVIDLGQN